MKPRSFLLFLALISLARSANFAPKQCNSLLMSSFELTGSQKSSEGENLLCPQVEHNCCPYETQLHIYKKWQVISERKRITDFYKEFTKAFESIYNTFGIIEVQAAKTKELTSDIPNSNCFKLAKSVLDFSVSATKTQVIAAVQKAFKFLLNSRRGFYCALCDADSHPYFNKDAEELIVSADFCRKMVEETLNYYLFKQIHFTRISRLYAEFTVKCDLKGNYKQTRMLKHATKFYKKEIFSMEITNCKKGFAGKDGIKMCQNFCKRYNPVKFNENLEGELEKLFSYLRALQNLLSYNAEALKRDEFNHSIESVPKTARVLEETQTKTVKNRRVLAETDSGKKSKAFPELDEEKDQVSEFNEENGASLINSITYDFDEDLSTRHRINFDDSIFGMGLERFYNLVEYKSIYSEEEGLDFYTMGKSASIRREQAVEAFKKMNPENVKAAKEFEAMMSS